MTKTKLFSTALHIVLVLALSTTLFARDLTQQERLADFDQMVSLLKANYGMIEYKKQTLGIDLDKVAATYREKIAQVAKDDEFYDLLSMFIGEFKDAHLGHYRPSSMSARLGFGVKRIEGKAIVTEISEALPRDIFPFKPGDELVSLDGVPVEQIVQKMLPTASNSRPESLLNFVTAQVPYRSGWCGSVPTGLCKVEMRQMGSQETVKLTLPWIVVGKPLPGLSFYKAGSTRGMYPLDPSKRRAGMFVNPLAAARAVATPMPAWAPNKNARQMETSQFDAAMFKTDRGTIGYIRIPSFTPEDEQAAIEEFGAILTKMQKTSGLILDLNDNPGGSAFYMLSLLSMLTDKPMQAFTVSDRASRLTLTNYRQMAQQMPNASLRATFGYQAQAIEQAMEQGNLLTPQSPVWGSLVAPHEKINYTKPIVCLVNDQCYSCGDIFPSILQDNKRAIIFGSNTAGAGGSVNSYGPLPFSGSSLSITETIMQRSSGGFIENVGVKPDVPYEVTQADVASGYETYRMAYLALLYQVLPELPPPAAGDQTASGEQASGEQQATGEQPAKEPATKKKKETDKSKSKSKPAKPAKTQSTGGTGN